MDAGPEQEKADCVSTCPPVGILDDSSWIQSTINDDGEVEYIQIDDTGLKTEATIVAVEDDDGHTIFTLTAADDTVTDHIKYNGAAAGSDIARKTTSTTTTTTFPWPAHVRCSFLCFWSVRRRAADQQCVIYTVL